MNVRPTATAPPSTMNAANDRLTRIESTLLAAASAVTPPDSAGSVGVDVVDVERIRRLRSRNAERFESLAFTDTEIAYCRSKHHPDIHFAGHLAAKEATFKALGLTWDRAFSWRYLEVRHRPNGSPTVGFTADGAQAARETQRSHVSVSIAHVDAVAIAVAWIPLLCEDRIVRRIDGLH